MAAVLERFADNGWLNIVGGCCGTSFEHTAPSRRWSRASGRASPRHHRALVLRHRFRRGDRRQSPADHRRADKRKWVRASSRRLINDEKYEEASEIARRQVKSGAQIIDVNLQNADRDETVDIDRFHDLLGKKVRAPIAIDTDGSSHWSGR